MTTMSKSKTLQASLTPEKDIEKIAYVGQPLANRQYKTGYEAYFNLLPVLTNDSPSEDLATVQSVMKDLSKSLRDDSVLMEQNVPGPGEFNRTIVAMEEPKPMFRPFTSTLKGWKEGAELVVAKWGDGFTSPVHGHSTGYMHEEILKGKMRVNTYRIVDNYNKIVRPVETVIVGEGVFVSEYAEHDLTHLHKRQTLVHNFVSIGYSASLHFLPEHTRDGRDNTFTVDHFNKGQLTTNDVERIDSRQGMYLQPGDVVLVRSINVKEYGDHYLVVTGPPVKKEHGFRVQDKVVMASPDDMKFLDLYEMHTGLTLLKLKTEAKEQFLKFHGIEVKDREVTFPKP